MSEQSPTSPLPEQEFAQISGSAELQTTIRQFAGETAVRGLGRFFKRRRDGTRSIPAETIDVNPQNAGVEVTKEQPETEPQAESYVFLDKLLSPASLQAEKSRLRASIDSDPLLSAFGSVYEAKLSVDRAWNEAYSKGDRERANQIEVQAAGLRERVELFDNSVANRYIKLSVSIGQIDKHSKYAVAADSETGQALLQSLQAASSPKEKDLSAPFAHYAENEADSWRAVSKDEALNYLTKREFKQHMHPEDGMIMIDSTEGEPFEVPLDLVKNASGFDDWRGRKSSNKPWESEYGDGEMASLDVIKHYAGLPTEIPPIGEIRVMISPDGKITCDNGSGDSHRISAAILRGDTTIKANKLHFVRLPEN